LAFPPYRARKEGSLLPLLSTPYSFPPPSSTAFQQLLSGYRKFVSPYTHLIPETESRANFQSLLLLHKPFLLHIQ
jgi:hypothetical protein